MTLKKGLLSVVSRSQHYDVEGHNYVNDNPEEEPVEERQQRQKSNLIRRESSRLTNFLRTLRRKSESERRKSGTHEPGGESEREQASNNKKSERSKSFNIKCDSKTSPYFEIELIEEKRRRQSDGYNRRVSISEYAKMFPELLAEFSEGSAVGRRLIKTNSFNVGPGCYEDENSDYGYRPASKVQRSASSVSELATPFVIKSDDIVSTRPEGGYEDPLDHRRRLSSRLDDPMPSASSSGSSASVAAASSNPLSSSSLSASCLTLPSRKSAFRRTNASINSSPGLSRTQELEDYARQYENLYSKRILSNRSGGSISSSISEKIFEPIKTPQPKKEDLETQSSYDSNHYNTMSLPRKLPPVKVLVSAFNDQIHYQQKQQQRLRNFVTREKREAVLKEEDEDLEGETSYGTIPRKKKSSLKDKGGGGNSSQFNFSTLRKNQRKNFEALQASSSAKEWSMTSNENYYHNVQPFEKCYNNDEGLIHHHQIPPVQSTPPAEDTIDLRKNNFRDEEGREMNAAEFEIWRRRQEIERDRIRRLGREPTPPKLPPKKPHLRSKGTFLLETDFDENNSALSIKKPPAPSPPPTSRVSEWSPPSTSTPENNALQRTYHKDSYMAHRRECLGQEGRYRRTGSPSGGQNNPGHLNNANNLMHLSNNDNSNLHHNNNNDNNHTRQSYDIAREEFHRSLLHSTSHDEEEASSTVVDLELSNLSLSSAWEKNSATNPSSTSVLFTSDAIKKIRRQRTNGRKNTPPEVAPKPYRGNDNGSLSASSFNVSGSYSSNAVNYDPSPIHSSKSTPSLSLNDNVSAGKIRGQHSSSRISEGKSSTTSLEKWKLSVDSLDTASSMSTSPPSTLESNNNNNHNVRMRSSSTNLPRPSEIRTTKSGVLDPQPVKSNRIIENHHQTSPPKHFHSNSDSGLSSLGGRTMSPVSTISSVSSGSSVSSRASLRSASIVSSVTLPGEGCHLKEEDEEEDVTSSSSAKRVSDSSPSSRRRFDSGTLSKKRHKFQEEIDCEEMSKELLHALNSYPLREHYSTRNLKTLFVTSPTQKTLADYVQGVLELDLGGKILSSVSRSANSNNNKPPSPSVLKRKIQDIRNSSEKKGRSSSSSLMRSNVSSSSSCPATTPSISSSSSLSNQTNIKPENNSNEVELERKKDELLKRISQKLDVLRAEQLSLKEEISLNEELGRAVGDRVKRVAKLVEYEKFDLHVQEIDKITSLLLGLSGRLARVENSLSAFPPDDDVDNDEEYEEIRNNSDEKKILLDKRNKLCEQLDEAKRLKENIDRRSLIVSNILRKYLSDESYSDYDHFVKMKAKLIMDSREINDKIKLGEEQLHALKNSFYNIR